MSKLVAVAVLSVLVSGCYLGRSSSQKQTAYVLNGAALVAGTALIVTAGGDDCPEGADVSCSVGTGMAAAAQATAGIILALAGGAGLAINAAVETKHDRPPGVATSTPRPSAPATVTTPGLAPTAIQLR